MTSTRGAPFNSIEAAQDYLTLLSDTIIENKQSVATEIQQSRHDTPSRYLEVLELIAFNLEQLETHLRTSRRVLANLRKLRALLLNGDANECRCAAATPMTKGAPPESSEEVRRSR